MREGCGNVGRQHREEDQDLNKSTHVLLANQSRLSEDGGKRREV